MRSNDYAECPRPISNAPSLYHFYPDAFIIHIFWLLCKVLGSKTESVNFFVFFAEWKKRKGMALLPGDHEVLRGVDNKDNHALELSFKPDDTLESYTLFDQLI